MLIAVGGFQHETNTFAPLKATYADFEAPDAWPGLTRGPALLEAVRGINLPAAGFIHEARSAGHSIAPLTWCSATPSAHVERDAYERIVAMLLEDLRAYRRLDAVYLDLHGAMVAEHIDDADGELLKRVREVVGPGVPLVASLDFHANVSPLMVDQASALIAYRTYPHTDMSSAGARALRLFYELRDGPMSSALRKAPFLIPLTSQCTLVEPLAALMREVERLESGPIVSMNFTPGFPAADVAECGPAVFAYGVDPARVGQAVAQFAQHLIEREAEFALDVRSIESALRELSCIPHVGGRPVILADTQDNPGGGGTADATSLLKALIAHHTPRVLAGVLWDPLAAAHAHAAGIGAQIDLSLGAHAGTPAETPLTARFTVVELGDGRFTATGSFYSGSRMDLGPMALLRVDDVYIAVASRKQQAADQAMFRHLKVEPASFAVLALKSSVHFRADFGPIANRILIVAAPGANIADPGELPFTRLRPGVRLRPKR
ncbi:MAG: M81 family metallopeptidase [Steroidobacter sp.]